MRCDSDRSYGLWSEIWKWLGQVFGLVSNSTPAVQTLSCSESAHLMHSSARNLPVAGGPHYHCSHRLLQCLSWAFASLAC